VRHNGLVDGAMPCNRLLCLTLDEPWYPLACGWCAAGRVARRLRPRGTLASHSRVARGGRGRSGEADRPRRWFGPGASLGAMTWGSASADRSIIGIGWLVTVSAVTVNGMRATAAAMRYGFRRGEIFGGCEPRCGEHAITTCAPHLRVVGVGCVDCETQRTPDRLRGAINSRLHVWSKPSEW